MGQVGEVLVAEVLDRARDRAGRAVAEGAERPAEDVVALVEQQVEVGLGPLAALERGEGSEADLELLLDQCDNILGRSFCALADGAVSPITSSIKYFRDEYLQHLSHGGCPFDPAAATLFASTPAGASR